MLSENRLIFIKQIHVYTKEFRRYISERKEIKQSFLQLTVLVRLDAVLAPQDKKT